VTDTSDPNSQTELRHAPATLRNRDAILDVLYSRLPPMPRILEIASGTGEHAAFIAPKLLGETRWFPSDLDASALAGIDAHARASGFRGIEPARRLDVTHPSWQLDAPNRLAAIFCANMIHIAPWEATDGLMKGAGVLLGESGGELLLYGPFRRDGVHVSESNNAFDQSLRARNPAWGVRDLEQEVVPAAEAAGLRLVDRIDMPANNMIVCFSSARSP